MQFLTNLFGESGNTLVTAALALGIVVVLILLLMWVLRALFSRSSGARGPRQRRLAVVDTLPLDPKRHLLIVRRDNVEHLILVGGPQDLVVETGIPVEPRQPRQQPGPARQAPAEPAPRAEPMLAPGEPTPLDMLRPVGRPPEPLSPLPERRLNRHPGLLRPMNRIEPMPIAPNADGATERADSARTGAHASGGYGNQSGYFDHGRTADGA